MPWLAILLRSTACSLTFRPGRRQATPMSPVPPTTFALRCWLDSEVFLASRALLARPLITPLDFSCWNLSATACWVVAEAKRPPRPRKPSLLLMPFPLGLATRCWCPVGVRRRLAGVVLLAVWSFKILLLFGFKIATTTVVTKTTLPHVLVYCQV